MYPRLGDYPGLTLRASITSIICAGYKVLGEKRTRCINAWDFKTRWAKDVNDDYMVVKRIREVLATADAVITHNGKKFDWKHLQTRLMFHGLPPLPIIPHMDTCAEAKKHLYVFNNRLGTIGEFLTGQKKLENGGWDLWVDVHNRKPSALKLMTAYCKQDIDLTEKVFLKLRPLIKGIPNAALFAANELTKQCPRCGSVKIIHDGNCMLKDGKYQKYRCKNCGSVSKGERLTKIKPRLKVF